LRALRLRQHTEQVRHMVADLVRDHIGFREIAGLTAAAVKARFDLAEERGIEINALVARAIEWSHRRPRETIAALLAAAVKA
jgi:hypothetical protein